MKPIDGMHRSAFDSIGGSADLHFAYDLLGQIHGTFPTGLHKDYRNLAQLWCQRLVAVRGGGANVGYVNRFENLDSILFLFDM